MCNASRISEVRFAAARRDLRARGLIGWICFVLDRNLRLDGLAIRHSVDGRVVLSFPRRIDSDGVEHLYYQPLSDGLRDAIEREVIAAVRAMGHVA